MKQIKILKFIVILLPKLNILKKINDCKYYKVVYVLYFGEIMIKREIKNMSKPWKTVLFITFLLILSSSFIVEGNTDDTEILQVTYNFDNPKISTIEINSDFYDRITIQDGYTASNSGEPNIPSKGANILLPPNSKVENIEVIGKNMIKLGETFDIEPTPKTIPISNLKISEKIESIKIVLIE